MQSSKLSSTKHCATFLVVGGGKYTNLLFPWSHLVCPRPRDLWKPVLIKAKPLIVRFISHSDPHVSDPCIQSIYYTLFPRHIKNDVTGEWNCKTFYRISRWSRSRQTLLWHRAGRLTALKAGQWVYISVCSKWQQTPLSLLSNRSWKEDFFQFNSLIPSARSHADLS